jgi:hypothetical protein
MGEAKDARVQELKSSKVQESKGRREVERRRKRLNSEIAEVGTCRTRRRDANREVGVPRECELPGQCGGRVLEEEESWAT